MALNARPLAPKEARQRNEHWNRVLVLPVRLPEFGDEVALFERGAYDDPRAPQYVEEELVGREAGSRPDEQQHEQVERMTHVAIGTASHEGRGGRGGPTQGGLERKRPERVEPAPILAVFDQMAAIHERLGE